jgi:hypothetical protein
MKRLLIAAVVVVACVLAVLLLRLFSATKGEVDIRNDATKQSSPVKSLSADRDLISKVPSLSELRLAKAPKTANVRPSKFTNVYFANQPRLTALADSTYSPLFRDRHRTCAPSLQSAV